MAKELRPAPASGPTPLHLAAFEGRHAEVKALIQAGADVAAVDEQQRTPLHYAVAGGHVAVARSLLAAGASTSAADRQGVTPEVLARHSGFHRLVQVLLAARGVQRPSLDFREVMQRPAPAPKAAAKGPSAPSLG